MRGHSRVCFIIPPYILSSLSASTQDRLQEKLQQSLLVSHGLRFRRNAFAEMGMVEKAVGQKDRTIMDAQNMENLRGVIVRREGDPETDDVAVNEAYDAAGDTYDFYQEVFGRSSMDGKGMRMDSIVHYGDGFDNAFWDGREMVYGDGDGVIFNRFTIDLDVIAHELTHGVTSYEADLAYSGQPGALNESMSDVFGSLVKQWKLRQTAQEADWLIGANLLAPGMNGKALRSMSDPGTAYNDPKLGGRDPQPAHMSDYVETTKDDGGVHINSGIPNRAFYLAATKIAPNGFAWEKAGRIWYVTLTTHLNPASNFQDAANATYSVSGDLFGHGSKEEHAVGEAWSEVGIEVAAPLVLGQPLSVSARAARAMTLVEPRKAKARKVKPRKVKPKKATRPMARKAARRPKKRGRRG